MKEEKKKNELDGLVAKFGPCIGRGFEADDQYTRVYSTGIEDFDVATGIGGLPQGKIVEAWGPESCVEASTFIRYGTRTPEGRRQSCKGGTVERLYNRFHGIPMSGLGMYKRSAIVDSYFFTSCVNEEGRIFQNRVVDVISTGVRQCLEVETFKGYRLKATPEHKFWTGECYTALADLVVGDSVYIHNRTPYRVRERTPAISRIDIFVKFHPNAPTKRVPGTAGKCYTYRRLRRSRAVVEAALNGLSFKEYVRLLNDGRLEGLKFLSQAEHVHHLDEDCKNDALENLVVMSPSAHGREHALERHNNLRFVAVEDHISVIRKAGKCRTYDLRVASPFNNYVANGFVVHNSGKSALMLHMIGSIQKDLKKPCVYCDLEQATPPTWMRTLGIQRKRLVRVKGLPENSDGVPSGERFFDLLYALIDQDRYAVIVVDSIAVVTPARVVAGDVEDKEIPGLQARLVQHGLAKIAPRLNKTSTVLVFINQLRSKVNVMWGSPEDQPGGRALKHWKALSVRVSRAGGDKIPDAHTVKIKVVKNKFAPPGGEAEVILNYKTGIDVVSGVLRAAISRGIVEGDRRKLTLLGRSYIGREKLKQALSEDPEFLKEVRRALREKPHAVEAEQGRSQESVG